MSSHNVTIDDLVVVDFPSGYLETIKPWKEGRQIPYSMSCARQVWYGSREDFADFPVDPAIKAVRLRKSSEAYAFLLSFAAGFEHEDYDTHNRSQFLTAWDDVTRTMPETARRFAPLMREIQLDSNLINNALMVDYRKPLLEMAARDLSGQKKGQQIVIVGSISKGGTLGDYTKRLITVTEQRQRQQPGHNSFITLTHPERAGLAALENEVTRMKLSPQNNCCIRSVIKFAPFVDLIDLAETHDHIYVDLPMGQNLIADNFIIEVWQERQRRDNTLTHMRGSPGNKGMSVEPWTTAGLDHYTSPEELFAEKTRRHQVKKELWRKAEEAFDTCAALRFLGIKPDKPKVFGSQSKGFLVDLGPVRAEQGRAFTPIRDESDGSEYIGPDAPGNDGGPG